MNENYNNTQCDYADDPLEALKFFNFGLTVMISIFGLIGNNLVVLVNKRAKNISSTDVYITALAVTDNLLILAINIYCYRYVYPLVFPGVTDWRPSGIFTLIGVLLTHLIQQANTYIIVLLSIDRYIQVRHSVTVSQRWCTKTRAVILVCAAVAVSTLYNLPRMWEYIPLIVHNDVSIDICYGYFLFTHGIGNDRLYRLIYGFVFYLLVMYALPLTVLSYTNYTLIRTILKRRSWRRKIHQSTNSSVKTEESMNKLRSRTEHKAILTLVIVMVSFMALQIPDMTLQFVWRLTPDHGPTASIFAYQLMIINASINFIIYAVSSNVFKKRLVQVFQCLSDGTYGEKDEATMLGAGRNSTGVEPTVARNSENKHCDSPQANVQPSAKVSQSVKHGEYVNSSSNNGIIHEINFVGKRSGDKSHTGVTQHILVVEPYESSSVCIRDNIGIEGSGHVNNAFEP